VELIALVADDDDSSRNLLKSELRKCGFEVVEARDGEEAYEKFRREDPDLVVTDLRMPRAGGLDLIERIRNEAGSWVPLVVVTSHMGRDVMPELFQAGQGAATQFLHLGDIEQIGDVAARALEVNVRQLREQQRNRKYQQMRRLLRECDGVIAHVADRMGTDRNTVYYHLKKFGLF